MKHITRHHSVCICVIALIGYVLLLCACGVDSTQRATNGFGMTTASQSGDGSTTVSSIELSSASVRAASTVGITVNLAQPSPQGGVTVQVATSDPLTVKVPATLQIPAGQTSATIELAAAAMPTSSSVVITASNGDSTARARVNVASPTAGASANAEHEPLATSNATGNPNATFKGCWYKTRKARYQGVEISVGTAGSYPFNAVLYNGTTCNASDVADQFGFGNPLTLGKETYIFWFADFMNKTNMSALWYLGNQKSKCVAYTVAPTC
ncbi:MAG: hypothetical protein WB729_13365 [Candidatus Sulfotelmatobacter sp.]